MRAAQRLLHQQDEAAVQAAREQASAGRGQRGRDPRVPLRIQIPGPGQDPRGRVPSTSGVTEVYHTNEAPSAPQAGPPAKPQWSMWGPRRPGTHSEASSYAESTHRPSPGWLGRLGGGEPGYGGPPQESPQEPARRFEAMTVASSRLGASSWGSAQRRAGGHRHPAGLPPGHREQQLQAAAAPGGDHLKGYPPDRRPACGRSGALVSSYMERVHRN